MAKYSNFKEWLKNRTQDNVEITFSEIDKIINDTLPPSARKYFRFWNNEPAGMRATLPIINADFRIVAVDMEIGKLRLKRGHNTP